MNDTEELNQILFEQLRTVRRVTGEKERKKEIEKTKAMVSIAQSIIDNAKIGLEGRKYLSETGYLYAELPQYLQIEKDK